MENQAQICGDAPLLLWYAAGALGEEEAGQVARHVADCAGCQALVQENQKLAQIYLSVSGTESPHLSPETLVRAATGETSGEDVADVSDARRHLAGCDECRQLVSVLERVQSEEQQDSSDAEGFGAGIRAIWAGFVKGPWMMSPLPAYMLALLLLYPAYRGLVGGGANQTPRLLDPPLPIASETERGPSEVLLRVEAGSEQTVVTVFVPIAPGRYRYELELRSQGGRRLFFTEDARSFDGVGTFALTLPGRFLGSGDYELRVGEWERDGGALANEYVFTFSVERE